MMVQAGVLMEILTIKEKRLLFLDLTGIQGQIDREEAGSTK